MLQHTCDCPRGVGEAHEHACVARRDVHVIHAEAAAREAGRPERQARGGHSPRRAPRHRHQQQRTRRPPKPFAVETLITDCAVADLITDSSPQW